MPRQERHASADLTTEDAVETTLGDVRRANLNGSLYPHPRSRCKRKALRKLARCGLAERIAANATCIGGWFARLRD